MKKVTIRDSMMPDLPVINLDEATHIYTVNGTVKASVTQVLETLLELEQFNTFVDTTTGQTIPADAVRQAGDFGRAFHKVAKFVMEGKKVLYPAELKRAKEELERWRDAEQAETVAAEMKVYCPKLDVSGTLDWIGHINRNACLNLVDWKTSKYNLMVGPQTWAYEKGYRAMTGYRGMIKRWAWIYDKKKGAAKFVELTDPTDEHEFRARNYDYKWRRR